LVCYGMSCLDNFCRDWNDDEICSEWTVTKRTKGADLMALTKIDIVESISNQIGYSKNQSKEIVETLLEIIKASLELGDDVLVSGFGKFCVNQKAERRGRNPATGGDMMLKPRKVVTFKCSGKLRDKINA